MTRTRNVVLAVIAIAIAGVCIRLGFWQLGRLDERRAENARVSVGLRGEPIAIASIGTDSTRSRAQRVNVRGTYDFEHEIALINRSRDGAPGVNILTPLRVDGSDTAVMVNRGWVYSADGATIELDRWREPAEAIGTAYVSGLSMGPTGGGQPAADAPRRVMRTDRQAIARLMPYPIAPYQLVLIDESVTGGARGVGYGEATASPLGTAVARDSTIPIRIPLPPLDEGPHKSYAAQWFAFAAISLIGTAAVLRKEWPHT